MGKSSVKWSGEKTYTINGDEYEVEFTAYGTYYYDPGCMYLRNGDPGYPPEEDVEVEEVEIESLFRYDPVIDDGVEVVDDAVEEAITEAIIEALCDGQYEVNYDEPYYPEPEEYEND